MLRAIVWKEFREQGLIGLTLIVFGTAILAAAATFADAPSQGASPADVVRFLGAGLLAALMLSVTAGTVCGGALFAAEREAGTIGFLESLPVSRWRIWRAKLAAGLLLAFAQIAIVIAVATMLGFITSSGWVFAITVFALLAFAWGAYGSTHAQTTLGSVGVAVPVGTAAFILYYIPLWLLFPNPRTSMLRPEGGLIFIGLMFLTPLLGSVLRFTRLDRERTEDDFWTPLPFATEPQASNESRVERDPFTTFRPRIGIRALVWLSVRQLLKPGLCIAAFALVFGIGLLPDSVHPVMLWPGMALSAGVLAGVTVFMDEQSSGAARFWGERRLPVGRLWIVKLVVHAAFALVLVALMLLPGAIRVEVSATQSLRGGNPLGEIFRSLLFDHIHLGGAAWNFLLLPVAYGFAAGHLCGMLFKKAVVAAGVAGVVGGSVAAFWLPSLLSGGTHAWQLWSPPMLALGTAWILLRAWTSDRLATRRPLTVLATGLTAVLLVVAAGLGQRVLDVPDQPDSEADVEYVASLPPLEALDAARLFRTAAERFARATQAVPTPPRTPGPSRGILEDRVNNLPHAGWIADDAEAAAWMDRLYKPDPAPGDTEEPWFVQAAAAGRDPNGGLFEHPLRTGTTSSLQTMANGRRMGLILLGHGLQRQAHGDHAAFTNDLHTTLALARTYRNGSVTLSLGYGNEIGRATASAVDHWASQPGVPADQLKAVIRELQADAPNTPFDARPHLLAERYVLRELVKAPAQFLPAQLTPPGKDRDHYAPVIDLIGVAWNTPWERERTRRLSGLGYEGGQPSAAERSLVRGRPGSGVFLARRPTVKEMTDDDLHLRLHRNAALITVALRLHHLETGTLPASLEDLVSTGRLACIPIDPFSGSPFRYRISTGETLLAPPGPLGLMAVGGKTPAGLDPRPVPAGHPIVWSVGANRTDDGGKTLPTRPGSLRGGPDLVYLPQLPGL